MAIHSVVRFAAFIEENEAARSQLARWSARRELHCETVDACVQSTGVPWSSARDRDRGCRAPVDTRTAARFCRPPSLVSMMRRPADLGSDPLVHPAAVGAFRAT
jgi:hypothetical protein